MNSDAWFAVIAAIITALGTLIATKFDDITNWFRKPARNVTGNWEIVSERALDHSWVGDFELILKQSGAKVKGTMVAVKVEEGRKKYSHTWTGKITGDYLQYESRCDDPAPFMVASGLLHIDRDGMNMKGYFIANSESDRPDRTWVGHTNVRRKN